MASDLDQNVHLQVGREGGKVGEASVGKNANSGSLGGSNLMRTLQIGIENFEVFKENV
jgi:hypothetical protein